MNKQPYFNVHEGNDYNGRMRACVDNKPANVRVWNNMLPSTLNPGIGHNWVAHIGGRWGKRRGANNIVAKPIDGHDVGHGSYSGLTMGEWL